MKQQFLKLFFIAFISSISIVNCICAQECGTDRWGVKTVRDQGAGQINWKVTASSVSAQCSIPRTITLWKTLPRQADEMQLYQIPCILVGLGKETDSDFHLIIRDPQSGETMVAEIPDPACKEIASTKTIKRLTNPATILLSNVIKEMPTLTTSRNIFAIFTNGFIFSSRVIFGSLPE
jgi:hypothetical protein